MSRRERKINSMTAPPMQSPPAGPAALKPEPLPATCAHHGFSAWRTVGGWPDDHTMEQGWCADCRTFLQTITWESAGRHHTRPLTTEEISVLKHLYGGNR